MTYKIGAYLRLSQNDLNDVESNSISNQKKLIKNYLKNFKDINYLEFYIDDGYTGTNFNRPSLQKMFCAINKNKINMIIIKDLSRLGRNYLEIGNYIEFFREKKIRFISINDNIDSFNINRENNILIPFKNLLNDNYSKDLSRKIKASLNIKKRNGEFVNAFAPYGYIKDPHNKNKLIIDKYASKIIKKIFHMALENYSYTYIATELNKLNILSPYLYKKEKLNLNIKNRWNSKNPQWSSMTVAKILKNRIYCGDLVQNINNEKLIIKNNHEAIIDSKTFNIINQKKHNTKNSLLGDYLICSNCHKKMLKIPVVSKNEVDYIYYCSTYRKTNKRKCLNTSIKNSFLEKYILDKINIYINEVQKLQKAIISYFNNDNYFELLRKEHLRFLNKKLAEKEKVFSCLDNDYNNSIIEKNDYLFYKEELTKDINNLYFKLTILSQGNCYSWLNKISNLKINNKLTKGSLEYCINRIYVNNTSINIEFQQHNFISDIKEIINFSEK